MKTSPLVATVLLCTTSAAVAQLAGGWRAIAAPWHPAFGVNARYDFAYDALRSECVLVRAWGNSGANIAIDTWDGSHWQVGSTPQSPGAPAAYQFQAAAHDPARDRLVLVDYAGSTWEWDRVQWTAATSTPFGPRELDLCWDAVAQRIVTVVQGGIHHWDGTAWTLVAGSALPQAFPFSGGLKIARDESRDVLIACGVSQFGGPLTMEWNGSSWQTSSNGAQAGMEPVSAPGLGGVIGYRPSDPLTYRWNHVIQAWEVPGFGGSPGAVADFALTWDAQRQRAVMFAPVATPTWEYDPNYVPPRTTWIVDPGGAGHFTSFGAAVQAAIPGDRIVVRPGNYSFPYPVIVDRGLQIDCDPNVLLPPISVPSLIGTAPLTISGGRLASAHFGAPGSYHLRGLVVDETVAATGGGQLLVEDCQIGQAGYLGPVGAALTAVNGDLFVDGSTVIGGDGTAPNPYWHENPNAGIAFSGGQLHVSASTITGGNGYYQTFGSPAAPAVDILAGTALLSGGSVVTGGTSPISGIASPVRGAVTVTADTVWNGVGAPAVIVPNRSRLTAPLSVAIGSSTTVGVVLQPGHAAVLAADLSWSSSPFASSWLPLLLPPPTVQIIGLFTSAAPNHTLTVPNVPSLSGQPTFWQALVIDQQFDFELSNLRSVFVQ